MSESSTLLTQRDIFWNRMYDHARADTDVIAITADMGAPALDRFRRDLPGQFINVGIAEQNAILIGSGLALTGKKVYCYAIAPFITINCLEKIRVENSVMGIPLTIVGVGAGFSYPDSGPTHHGVDDLAVMRALPGCTIYNVSDNSMCAWAADSAYRSRGFNYLRFDRSPLPQLHREGTDFAPGAVKLSDGDSYILATGNMVHMAVDLAARMTKAGGRVGVIDVYRFPIEPKTLASLVSKARKLVTLEEHFLPGGLGSAVAEVLCDEDLRIPMKRIGMKAESKYCYQYGGREKLRAFYGIDVESVSGDLKSWFAGSS